MTEVQSRAVVDTCIEAPACHVGFLTATERTPAVSVTFAPRPSHIRTSLCKARIMTSRESERNQEATVYLVSRSALFTALLLRLTSWQLLASQIRAELSTTLASSPRVSRA